jgi:hypothetical protein
MNLPQGVPVQPNIYQQSVLQPPVPQAPARPVEPPAPPQGVAVRPVAAAPKPTPVQSYQQAVAQEPEVRIVRRNLTVAELIAVILIAMVGLSAVQFVWSTIPKPQVNIEWKR